MVAKGLRLNLDVALLEHQVRADDALPHVLHVLDDGLKVRGRVVRARHEHVVLLARRGGLVERRDRDELVVDGAEEVQAGLDLLLRAVGLDDGGDDGNEDVLSADVVCRGNDGDVDVYMRYG